MIYTVARRAYLSTIYLSHHKSIQWMLLTGFLFRFRTYAGGHYRASNWLEASEEINSQQTFDLVTKVDISLDFARKQRPAQVIPGFIYITNIPHMAFYSML